MRDTSKTYTPNKGLLSNIFKELKQLTDEKQITIIFKWSKDLMRHFSEEEIKIANSILKWSFFTKVQENAK